MPTIRRRFQLFCMHKYEKLFHVAEKKWPLIANYSRHFKFFKEGISLTFTDFSIFLGLAFKRITSDTPGSDLSGLSRQDLRLLRTVPHDMIRLAPLLFTVALPGTAILLPLFLAFPQLLLTRTFWTIDQKRKFDEAALRLQLNGPRDDLCELLGYFSDPHRWLREDSNVASPFFKELALSRSALHETLLELSKSKTPSSSNIRKLIPLFDGPLNLNALNHLHITSLCGLHGIVSYRTPIQSSVNYRRPFAHHLLSPVNISSRLSNLEQRGRILQAEDKDILQTLNAGNLISSREITELCLLRGINGYNQTLHEQSRLLQQWASLSMEASDASHSYRLHLPFLMNFQNFIRRPSIQCQV